MELPDSIADGVTWRWVISHILFDYQKYWEIKSSSTLNDTHIISHFYFQLHNKCASHVDPECKLGVNRVHLLPPTCICPTVLDRQHSVLKEKKSNRSQSSSRSIKSISRSESSTTDGSVNVSVFLIKIKKTWDIVVKDIASY